MSSNIHNNTSAEDDSYDEVFVDVAQDIDEVQAQIIEIEDEYDVEVVEVDSEYDVDVIDLDLQVNDEDIDVVEVECPEDDDAPPVQDMLSVPDSSTENYHVNTEEDTEIDDSDFEKFDGEFSAESVSGNLSKAAEGNPEKTEVNTGDSKKWSVKSDPLGVGVLILFIIFGLLFIAYLVKIFF